GPSAPGQPPRSRSRSGAQERPPRSPRPRDRSWSPIPGRQAGVRGSRTPLTATPQATRISGSDLRHIVVFRTCPACDRGPRPPVSRAAGPRAMRSCAACTHDRTPADVEPLRPEDPAEIGGYPVVARIGAGGMGQVYLGLTAGGRHVALKVVRADFDGPQALARFRREVATVERVRSRFAAARVGAGRDEPPYWRATEYVPGPTLRQAVAEHGPLPPDTCIRLLAALAQGLLEIHGQGVQHRDLKPGNVILAPDGPRLIDFGIARGEGQTQITRTGAWNGTPGYVAPEVVRDQEPVPASDVFSLAGTIAY